MSGIQRDAVGISRNVFFCRPFCCWWQGHSLTQPAFDVRRLRLRVACCSDCFLSFRRKESKRIGPHVNFRSANTKWRNIQPKKKLSVSPVSSKIRLIDVRAPDRWPFRISCSSFACVMFPPFSRMNGLAKEGGKRSGRSSHLHRRLFESTSRSLRLIWLANEYQFLSIW